MLRLSTIAFLLLATTSCEAATSVFGSPQGFYIAPSVYNHTLYGPSTPYGTSSDWYVTQWGQWNGDFVPFSGTTTNNLSGTITYGSPWATLTARGYWDSAHKINCNVEYDMFMSPTDPATYPGYPSGNNSLPLLNAVTNLTHTLTYEVLGAINEENTCAVTQSFAQSSFIMSNTVTGDTFFFQIDLFDYNFANSRYLWFFTGANHQWGVTVPITWITKWTTFPNKIDKAYAINNDILPQIKTEIAYATAHYGMDGDLSHWKVSSAYTGQAIWGRYNLNVEYTNWGLTY